MDDFFAELEAEIALATAKDKKLRDVEKLRKRSNNKFLPKDQREAAKQKFQLLRQELQADLWTVEAEAILFMEQSCDGCGSTHRIFLQFMQKLRHKKLSQIHWERIIRPSGTVPKETLLQRHTTHICADCADEHGFYSTNFPETIIHSRGPAVPSATYQPADLNSPFEGTSYAEN